ncbi:hypothetical protein ACFQ63_40950, partial [Streptomyces wedmorensis]
AEYQSSAWCGEPASQLGSRSPRRYCTRSPRQRAFEARRLGVKMKWQRDQEAAAVAAAPVVEAAATTPPATVTNPPLWEDDMADRLARYGIGTDGQELPRT